MPATVPPTVNVGVGVGVGVDVEGVFGVEGTDGATGLSGGDGDAGGATGAVIDGLFGAISPPQAVNVSSKAQAATQAWRFAIDTTEYPVIVALPLGRNKSVMVALALDAWFLFRGKPLLLFVSDYVRASRLRNFLLINGNIDPMSRHREQ
ncbi:hypothetical protein PQQ51_23165 [Paraburkholderia xenovorans]|uniref:hypothetical protein n=1 Tax=Paraburkholderia xenovorans TaxID=36873 RepID=UPI0038BA5B4F